jgi:hypothetical protein
MSCNPLIVNRRYGGTCQLRIQAPLANFFHPGFLAYSLALKMEAMCSSETSGGFQRTARCYITQARTLHNLRCENLKSYISSVEL